MRNRSQNHIFINYARADSAFADSLYDLLEKKGFRPWMDRRDILAGEDWKLAIDSAVEGSAIFLAVISESSAEREGYLQVEIKNALQKKLGQIPGKIFIIPLRIQACEYPWFVKRENLQVLDWENGRNKKQLFDAICASYQQQGIDIPACN
jgi:hypothetical protein